MNFYKKRLLGNDTHSARRLAIKNRARIWRAARQLCARQVFVIFRARTEARGATVNHRALNDIEKYPYVRTHAGIFVVEYPRTGGLGRGVDRCGNVST